MWPGDVRTALDALHMSGSSKNSAQRVLDNFTPPGFLTFSSLGSLTGRGRHGALREPVFPIGCHQICTVTRKSREAGRSQKGGRGDGFVRSGCRHANISSELVGLRCNLDQVRNPCWDGGGLMLVYNELQKKKKKKPETPASLNTETWGRLPLVSREKF